MVDDDFEELLLVGTQLALFQKSGKCGECSAAIEAQNTSYELPQWLLTSRGPYEICLRAPLAAIEEERLQLAQFRSRDGLVVAQLLDDDIVSVVADERLYPL